MVTPARSPTNGIVRLSREEQPESAPNPMLVTLSGMTSEVSPVQSRNACSPIFTMLSGISIEVKELQLLNAHFEITFTGFD